jgi:hypothetical protein
MNLPKGFAVGLGKLKGKPKVVKPLPPPLDERDSGSLMLDLMLGGGRVKNERLNATTGFAFSRQLPGSAKILARKY